jgi:uncharacterized alpha-E superfamily protein
MLSRTADHLYWMSRYNERTENLARMLDAHYRFSLLPRPAEAVRRDWTATLTSLGMREAYEERYGAVSPQAATEFLAFDREHRGSILSSLRTARENARAVRGTMPSEVWETINATWLEARSFGRGAPPPPIGDFIEWVKYRANLTRGVIVGTMLRDEAYAFSRIGTFLERADATTRILEARWRDADPDEPADAAASEWAVLLRALSAFEVYRKVYRDNVTPRQVTELLLLNESMPRSVHRCLTDLYAHLVSVRNAQSRETERRAGELQAQLRFGRLDELCVDGVAEYLDYCQGRLNEIADGIASDFLVPGL